MNRYVFFILLFILPCTVFALKPVWIDQPPVDNAYYIGIGTSNTGVEADDINLANAMALTRLAGEISISISEEFSMSRQETAGVNTSGQAFVAFEENVSKNLTQQVSAKLSAADYEVVGKYNGGKRGGYWIYLRISKAYWEMKKKKEMQELNQRVTDLITSGLEGKNLSQLYSNVFKSYQAALASPYSLLIKTTISGKSGTLLDVIDAHYSSLKDLAVLQLIPDAKSVETGKMLTCQLLINSSFTSGVVPFTAVAKTGTQEIVFAEGLTTPDGKYSGTFGTASLPIGKITLIFKLNQTALGLDPTVLQLKNLPEARAVIEVKPLSAYLQVKTSGTITEADLKKKVESLFSDLKIPFALGNDDSAAYKVSFNLDFIDQPNQQYGLLITRGNAVVSIERDGDVVFSWTLPQPLKKGGELVSPGVVHMQLMNMIMDEFRKSTDLAEKIKSSVVN